MHRYASLRLSLPRANRCICPCHWCRPSATSLTAVPNDPCGGCPPPTNECEGTPKCLDGLCTYPDARAGTLCSVGQCDGRGSCGE